MTFASLIGALATFLSSLVQPSQFTTLLHNKHNTAMLREFSMQSLYCIIAGNGVWFVYGLTHDAIWTAVLAVIAITIQLTIVMLLIRTRTHPPKTLLTAICVLAASIAVSYPIPNAALGPIGCAFSMIMFVPAARAAIHALRTKTATPYSMPMATIMCLGNLAWGAYAVAIHDIWVGLPIVANVPISLIMLKVAYDQRGTIIRSVPQASTRMMQHPH